MIRQTSLTSVSLCLFSVLVAAPPGAGGDWPQFRGPDGLGTSKEKDLPVRWSADKNLAWKTELPGPGSSSPITVGERIFVTCYSGYGLDAAKPGDMKKLKRHLVCLDRAKGRIRWSRQVPATLPEAPFRGPFITLHGYASSTPVTDGRRVFVFFGKSGVYAYTLDGEPVWNASVGESTHEWGSAASPVLYKNLVIVNAGNEGGYMVALNKDTGRVVWKTDRFQKSWTTPVLVPVAKGGRELVIGADYRLLAFDPASGKQLWTCQTKEHYTAPSVTAHAGVVYLTAGFSAQQTLAVRAGGKDDVTRSELLWKASKGTNVPSPVYHDGHLYCISDTSGIAYCLKAGTGEVVYAKRLEPAPGRIYASPIVADGKIYVVSRGKGVYVLAAKPEYALQVRNTLAGDDSVFNATPAILDGQLLLRSDRYLYCIGKRHE
jgi:outer membrane protein assembly factor BamB